MPSQSNRSFQSLPSPFSSPQAPLSIARRRLVQWMAQLNFGWIEQLSIRNGEPLLEPLPKCIQEVKLQGESVAMRSDPIHQLREPHLRLFTYFDQIQNVVIEKLLIKYGMPFKLDAIESFPE